MTRVIHWVCAENTPYNAQMFGSLAAESSLALTVHFIRENRDNHPWQATVPKRFPSRE
jgi:hypothetical protein